MIILTETTDKIQVVLGGSVVTNQLQCVASYRDITTNTYTAGRNVVTTNNITDVDLVGSPDASTQRVIDYIRVYNSDTANAVVTLKFNANGSEYILFSAPLSPSEVVEYVNGQGFRLLSDCGSVKFKTIEGNPPAITEEMNTSVLNEDVVNQISTANTMIDVTGLSFPVLSGVQYWFRFVINFSSAAATTGCRWAVSGPPLTTVRYASKYALTTTSNTINTNSGAYDLPATSSASSATINGNIAIIEGFVSCLRSGNIVARFASEVANSSVTAKAGSLVYYRSLQI